MAAYDFVAAALAGMAETEHLFPSRSDSLHAGWFTDPRHVGGLHVGEPDVTLSSSSSSSSSSSTSAAHR
jgi:hypothetical protein